MADRPLQPRLIVFDMDGTLITDRLIFRLAHRFGFETELEKIMSAGIPEYEKTKRIAPLLKGITPEELTSTFDQIPLSPGVPETVAELKKQGHILAIISDSYTIATGRLKKRLGFDHAIANKLVVREGKITGEVEMPLNWSSDTAGCLKHSVCKLNALLGLSEETGIPLERTVAIGDNTADICMLKRAGLGIAFNPKTRMVSESADITLNNDMSRLLAVFMK